MDGLRKDLIGKYFGCMQDQSFKGGHNRAITPYSKEDGKTIIHSSAITPHLKTGLIDLSDEQNPDHKVKAVVIYDVSEKLLGYFVTGGHVTYLPEEVERVIYDEDYALMVVYSEDSEPVSMFYFDKYGKQSEPTVRADHFIGDPSSDHKILQSLSDSNIKLDRWGTWSKS